MDLVAFWTICSANGIFLEREQVSLIERYAKELIYWNQKVNLISRKDEESVLNRHILHSLTALKYIEIGNKARCLDIGTGGGLPGIPIKIARQDLRMILIDSIAKKIKITGMLATHTGLNKIETMNIRAEILSQRKELHNSFDYIFARSVKGMSEVANWVIDILKTEGALVFYKGGDLNGEIEDFSEIYPEMGVSINQIKINGEPRFEQDDKKIVICRKTK